VAEGLRNSERLKRAQFPTIYLRRQSQASTQRIVPSAHAALHCESEGDMKKKPEKRELTNEVRREYDLSKLKDGVRGKYLARYRAGTNLVPLRRTN
jgi:hypothetical protein